MDDAVCVMSAAGPRDAADELSVETGNVWQILQDYLVRDRPESPDLPRIRKMLDAVLGSLPLAAHDRRKLGIGEDHGQRFANAAAAVRRAASAPQFLWEDSACPGGATAGIGCFGAR